MENIRRALSPSIKAALKRGKSVLLLGPRQVGKTTLLQTLPLDLTISLARPAIRQHYERDIESFSQEIEALAKQLSKKPLIAVDEIQKIPDLMDATQDLIDRKVAQFILTGSSARKLRSHKQQNWLPGRVVYFHLDPLCISELPKSEKKIETLLTFGLLPGIITEKNNQDRERDLESYIVTYLEEEVRQEALVRKISDFSRFLEFAACESGNIANFNRISNDIGVAQTTIAAYYQVLEDCLITERIDPFLKKSTARRRIAKSAKYLFFDLGVRRAAAREGTAPNKAILGSWFEQFIGLELLKQIRIHFQQAKLYFWRDLEGREVDWVVGSPNKITPIEVKWTEKPSLKDTRHLQTFLDDYKLKEGYVICRCKRMRKLDDRITAIPWENLDSLKLA